MIPGDKQCAECPDKNNWELCEHCLIKKLGE